VTLTRAGSSASIFSALVHPNWGIWEPCARAMLETIYLALMATTIAIPFAFLLSFLGARNRCRGCAHGDLLRRADGVEHHAQHRPIVWAIVIAVWVGIGRSPGCSRSRSVDRRPGEAPQRADRLIDRGRWRPSPRPGNQARWSPRRGAQIIPPAFTSTAGHQRPHGDDRPALGGGNRRALVSTGAPAQQSVGLILWMITVVVWVMDREREAPRTAR
jgi:hypothetical protein